MLEVFGKKRFNNMINENDWTFENIPPFSEHLDTLEKKIILPNALHYKKEIEFGTTLEDRVVTHLNAAKDSDLVTTVLKVISLQYRIGGLAPIKSKTDELSKAVLAWKLGIDLYIHKELTERDLEKIEALGRYARFCLVLLRNEKIQDEVFKLVFRDNFPIRMLVEYYKTCAIDLKNAL